MPPASSAFGPNPAKVNGRTYTAAVGATIDVPDFDATQLQANGWHNTGTTAATAARPVMHASDAGARMIDTTLAAPIRWDGHQWRNEITGVVV